MVAINPLFCEKQFQMKVMTWNVHCSKGTDSIRQKKIAELILKEDADFVQLNEYYQDSCKVIDFLLRIKYHYAEEHQSHRICGDIYYSKRPMSNCGNVRNPINGKSIQTIKATTSIGGDSVQIFGVHLASNRYNGNTEENDNDSIKEERTAFYRYKKGQESRCSQAYWTKMAVIESKHPVIVMGDTNDFSHSAPLDTLLTCGLKNAWWEGGNGYGHTFHDGWMRLRIDHILYSDKLKLCDVKVIDTNLSDHNPVVARFSVNN